MATTTTFDTKTNAEIRDDMTRTYKSAMTFRGVSNVNVSPGSEPYAKFQAIANEIEPIYANQQTTMDALMPDTTTGASLDRWLASYGKKKRSAQGSNGFVIASLTQSVAIAAGTQLIDTSSQLYKVDTSATYANGSLIPVSAVSTGKSTNHIAGDVLTWVSQPAYANPTATVATGGLVDGVDVEDDETARARLLDSLANPPGAGNWSQVAELAETSSNSVQKAFVYPTWQGPSTVYVSCVGYQSSSMTRDISSILMSSTVAPSIIGSYFDGAQVTVDTVQNVNEDVSISLALPSAPTAAIPGPGGGWLDGTPWPQPYTGYNFCDVTAVTSSTVFNVRASAAPTASVSRISWLSSSDWKVRQATVIGVASLGSGIYTITIDTPFAGITTGEYISPSALNIATYYQAVLTAFSQMGPGEVSSNAGVLVRGYRHPQPGQSFPYKVSSNILKALTNSGTEVSDAGWLYRLSNGAAPSAATLPPSIYVPRRIGLYPST